MNFQEMSEAVEDARLTERAFNNQCEEIAKLLVGNLRNISKDNTWRQHQLLRNLKAELSQYNARDRRWKN